MSADSYWSLEDVINGLVEALRVRTYIVDNSIQVEPCWPRNEQALRSIWIRGAKSIENVAGMRAGPIKNTENYTLEVVCDAFSEGGDTSAALALLTPMVGEVMREIAEKKRVDTPDGKVVAARVSGWEYEPYELSRMDATGMGAAALVKVAITGRR